MTVLIALEFNHTVLPEISSGTPIVKMRAVILVALLALARKLVLVDYHQEDFTTPDRSGGVGDFCDQRLLGGAKR